MRTFVAIGSISLAISVALGAFGAHILEDRLTQEMLDIFGIGNDYQMIHSLGLLIIGLMMNHVTNTQLLKWSGWLLCAGILIFSGSLYILALSGVHVLGAITPIGGFAFILGWLLLAYSVLRKN